MKPSKGIAHASLVGGTLLVLAACSSTSTSTTAKHDENRSRGAQAQSVGTPDEPTSCGSYFGDSGLNPISRPNEQLYPQPTQWSGRITEDSPKQIGQLVPSSPSTPGFDEHSCDAPIPTPTVDPRAGGPDVHYNAVFLKNWTNADACISASGFFVPGLSSGADVRIGVYVGPFDPNDISKNAVVAPIAYHWSYHFAFKVPANAVFEVVVSAKAQTYDDGTQIEPLGLTWGFNVANCGEPQSTGGNSSGGTSSDDAGTTTNEEEDAGGSSSEDDAGGGGGGKTW